MAENDNPEIPEQPADTAVSEPVPTAEPDPAYAVAPAPQPRLRDHLFSFQAVLAVALATLLLGGAGGAALVALTDDDHDGPRVVQFDGPGRDRGPGGFERGPGDRQAPPGLPGRGTQGEDAQPESGSAS